MRCEIGRAAFFRLPVGSAIAVQRRLPKVVTHLRSGQQFHRGRVFRQLRGSWLGVQNRLWLSLFNPRPRSTQTSVVSRRWFSQQTMASRLNLGRKAKRAICTVNPISSLRSNRCGSLCVEHHGKRPFLCGNAVKKGLDPQRLLDPVTRLRNVHKVLWLQQCRESCHGQTRKGSVGRPLCKGTDQRCTSSINSG